MCPPCPDSTVIFESAVSLPVWTTALAILDTPLYVTVVEREGLTPELTFIPHTWEEGDRRGNIVRGAIQNMSFHNKSKGVTFYISLNYFL